MIWNALLGFIRVNKGPDERFDLKFGWHQVYTFFNEQVAVPMIVPDGRLTLGEAST